MSIKQERMPTEDNPAGCGPGMMLHSSTTYKLYENTGIQWGWVGGWADWGVGVGRKGRGEGGGQDATKRRGRGGR